MKKVLIFLLLAILLLSCKKDKINSDIDAQLLEMAQDETGFTYYKKSNILLPKSSGSGHSFAYLKTRYNETAATMLDSSGKVKVGAVFPEGSLIVKELYSDLSTLARYAILYKNAANEFADENGWVWGYINSDQSVAVSASTKGNSCISCHTQSEHIDYMLMNKFFP